MEVHEGEILSVDQAMAKLYAMLPEIRKWSCFKIRTMKMPPASHGVGGPRGLRAPSLSAIRQSLQGDEDLLSSIELEAIVSFMRRVERGSIRTEEMTPYLYRTTERVADRRARRRAKVYLREVVPDSEADESPDEVLLPEEFFESREKRRRLGAIMMGLSPADLTLLTASVTRRYDEAAATLGIAHQTAKNRATLLRRRIRDELVD